MSVIIRLQNLPWSANALDIRNFFRGLSIPEGGVHIVGGELGDAFIAFSTDEDARQAMMLDGGKIKEIQVKLLLSSRSEMHKVIEAARQSVPILTLTAPTTAPAPVPASVPAPAQTSASITPVITPFSAALGNTPLSSFGIPGLGNPQEIPQPAVIEPPAPIISPNNNTASGDLDDEKPERKRSREKDRRRSRSRSRSRDRERKDRKRDRRDRSRSRDRRRRDRSRSRERRDRKRDRKDRSRSRERSPSRRSRDRRNDRKSPLNISDKSMDAQTSDIPVAPLPPSFTNILNPNSQGQLAHLMQTNTLLQNGPGGQNEALPSRFTDPTMAEAYNKLQELGKKRNPNAFQGDQTNGARFPGGRGGMARGGGGFRREGRPSRFDSEQQRDCCVAIRNAPNHTSYGDVRRFFPFLIDKHGIKMINDNTGRRTGNIYVRFCDNRSRQLALQRKYNELKGERVIVEALDDETYETAVDSFLPFREDNDDDDPSLVIADTEEPERPPFSVLKLTELPNFVKEHDIIKAFSDFSLLSIVLNDCRVTRTKIAYVQFVKPDDAKQALEKKERYVFGKRQANMMPVSNEEYDKIKLTQGDKLPEPPLGNTTIDTPPEVSAPRDPRQRRQQFENGPVPQVVPPAQVQPQNPQFFGAPFGQQQAFGAAFPAPQFSAFPGAGAIDPRTAAANWANRPAFPNPIPAAAPTPKAISTDMEDEPLDCVLMKGFPPESTDRTIVNFLSDTDAVPARIHLMLDANGLPSGDCFCEFRSTQEARRATTKHGHNLDGCRITVDLVSRSVVEEALEGPKQPEIREPLLGNGPPQFVPPHGAFVPRGSYRGRGGFDRGSFSRGGFDQGRGGYRGRGNWNDRGRGGFEGRGGFDRGRGRGFGRGRGGFENGREQRELRTEEEQDPALEDFGAPGCVVSMENVPFRASVDDILGFFSEFNLTQDDVIRRYNERGQPTGDARVAFRTPFDAQRAVKTHHMTNIYDRRISLSIL